MRKILSPLNPILFTLLTINLAWSGPIATIIEQSRRINNEFTQGPAEQSKTIATIDLTQPVKSYEELILNNDGSVTIVEPRFKNPSGQGLLPISARGSLGYFRNLNGACRLFGFKKLQVGYAIGDEETAVIINSKGKIEGFSKRSANSYNARTAVLVCREALDDSSIKIAPESRADAVYRNDDGTDNPVSSLCAWAEKLKNTHSSL